MSAAGPARPLKVALYARVSTSDGRQTADNQLRELRTFAAAHGWTVAGEYTDEESGAKTAGERRQLRRLMNDASRREFDRVIVWSLSRLTREGIAATFAYISRLKAAGVDLWSLTEEHFRTSGPAGDLFISIAAYIADQERKQHIERVRAGLERAKADGRTFGRPVRLADRQRIDQLHQAGRSIRQIATLTGLSRSTVARRLSTDRTDRSTPE